MTKTIFALLMLIATTTQLAFGESSPLQTTERDSQFAQLMSDLDLSSPKFRVEYKVGTTSVGLKIFKKEKYVAFWYPDENITARAEGQVVSYYLGRFLGVSDNVAPSAYFSVSGPTLNTYANFLIADTEDKDDEFKQSNIKDSLASAQENYENGTGQFGSVIVKLKLFEPFDLVDYDDNELNTDHLLAKFIRADEAHPSDTQLVDFPDFEAKDGQTSTSTELEVAKDLSRIMIVDMLAGQADRFSGGNLEAYFSSNSKESKDGRIRLIARDNGAAHLDDFDLSQEEFKKYISYVTRFDREQIAKVEALSELLKQDPDGARSMLKMISEVSLLQQRVKAVLNHVRVQRAKYGDENAFFQK